MTQITLHIPPLSYEELKAILCNELKKTENGYLCTVRGLARLLGISVSTLVDTRRQNNNIPRGVLCRVAECSPDILPESLKAIAGFDYRQSSILGAANKQTYLLPEVVISAVVKYYAYDARKTLQRAKQLDAMSSAVGVRAVFEQILNTKDEIDGNLKQQLDTDPVPVYVIPESNPAQDLLQLIQKLESYRLRCDQVVSIFENIGLLTSINQHKGSYRGVVQHRKKWRAQIAVNGTTCIIGSYETPEDAAKAYDSYAKVIHGSKAKLNF